MFLVIVKMPVIFFMFIHRQIHVGILLKWETDSYPHDSSPSDCPPLPCSVRVRVKSGVSRVRVGSVGLGSVGLVLGLGLWFVLGECPGGEMSRGNV